MSEIVPIDPVATVSFTNDKIGETAEDVCGIWPKAEYRFGSEDVQQHVNDHDPTISRCHVTIRCVQFDEDAARWKVAPMVYAHDQSTNGTILKRQCRDESGEYMLCECRLTSSMGPILLADGDRLYFSNTTFMEFREINPSDGNKMDFVMACETQRFMDSFTVAPRLIGAGGQGNVFIAWDQESGLQIACKAVPLRGVEIDHSRVGEDASEIGPIIRTSSTTPNTFSNKSQGGSAELLNKIHRLEVEHHILKDLDHPNIINMRKVFITTHHIYIFQELMTGGDLFSFIEYKGQELGDVLSAVITRQVLKGVEYLHERGIAHRDIKPDNILMTSWKDSARIVLTDFGQAKRTIRVKDDAKTLGTRFRMFSACGTDGFAAPEVHRLNPTIAADQGYSKAIDIWSTGSVAGLMLTGDLTFDDRCTINETGERVLPYDLSVIDRGEKGWSTVPQRARDFVKSLLQLDERKRLTAKQALQHHWFTNHTCASTFDAVYAHSIRDWKPRSDSDDDLVVHIDTSDIVAPSPVTTQPVRCSSPTETIYKSQFFRSKTQATDLSSNTLDEMDMTPDLVASEDVSDVTMEDSLAEEEPLEEKPHIQQPSPELPWPSPPRRRIKIHSPLPGLPQSDRLSGSSQQLEPSQPDDDDDLDNLNPSAEFPWNSLAGNNHAPEPQQTLSQSHDTRLSRRELL